MLKVEEMFYYSWKEIAINETMTQNERSEIAIWDYPVSKKWTKVSKRIIRILVRCCSCMTGCCSPARPPA